MEDKKEDFDKEIYLLRKELIELQNRERIDFFNWLFLLKVIKIDLGSDIISIPIPLNLTLFLILLPISFKIASIILGENTLFFSLFLNTLAVYLFYDRFAKTPKREKEENLLNYFKKSIVWFWNKIFE